MLPGDSRSRWDSGVFPDRRVVQFWDRDFAVGTWFGEHLDDIGAGSQTGGSTGTPSYYSTRMPVGTPFPLPWLRLARRSSVRVNNFKRR